MKKSLKSLMAVLLVGFAPVTLAATLPVFDDDHTHTIGIGAPAINYGGKIGEDGFSYHKIIITGSQGTATTYTTTYNSEGSEIALFDWNTSNESQLGDLIVKGTADGTGKGGAAYFLLSAFLTAGNYVLRITGADGSTYAGTISAVPLPGAALLFGSALFGAGVIGRKKLGNNKAEAVAA